MLRNRQTSTEPTRHRSARPPGHPGDLDDPGRPIAPLALDYHGAWLRPWHHHRRGQLLYADSGVMQVATAAGTWVVAPEQARSEEHTSELQSLMRSSYAVFCLQNKR